MQAECGPSLHATNHITSPGAYMRVSDCALHETSPMTAPQVTPGRGRPQSLKPLISQQADTIWPAECKFGPETANIFDCTSTRAWLQQQPQFDPSQPHHQGTCEPKHAPAPCQPVPVPTLKPATNYRSLCLEIINHNNTHAPAGGQIDPPKQPTDLAEQPTPQAAPTLKLGCNRPQTASSNHQGSQPSMGQHIL